MTTLLSVILATAHRRSMVLRFIDSLNAQTRLPEELIIADGSPSAEAEHDYRSQLRGEIALRYLHCELGLTRQRNRGLDAACGEIVCFFDDDVVLEAGYLTAVAETFEASGNESLGAISGRITNGRTDMLPSSLLARAHRLGGMAIRRMFFLSRQGDGRFLPSGNPTFLAEDPRELDCECLSGCCMAFRRALVAQLRFDERLSRYCYMEDDDIAYRVSRRARVRHVPRARCAHLHSSANRMAELAAGKMLMVNHHYLFRKNFPQDVAHRYCHALSLVGYPLLMFWSRNWQRCAGASVGLWSIVVGRDDGTASVPHGQS